MDLRWIAGSLDSDSEALEPVLLWIRSESHRKRRRRRRVCLSWPYIICVLVNDFRSFNDATNQRMTSGHSFFTCVNSFSFTTSCWRMAPTHSATRFWNVSPRPSSFRLVFSFWLSSVFICLLLL